MRYQKKLGSPDLGVMGYGADGVAAQGYVSGVGTREADGCVVGFGGTGQDAPRRAFWG
ncbi:MAG: hypothetical protein WC655_02290 [Candidatus Hydrogenedentales bacterium]